MASTGRTRYIRGMDETTNVGFLQTPASLGVDNLDLTPEQKATLLQSMALAEAQYQAGDAIPGADVLAWIRSWGSKTQLPTPTRKIRRP
jgi:hypothetical protein